MFTKTDICNIALGNIGQTVFIEDVDSDDSKEASICRRFYDLARRTSLTSYNWSFSRKVKRLSRLYDETDNNYNYVYGYPNDCLIPRYLQGTTLVNSNELIGSVEPTFIMGVNSDNTIKTILSNVEDAILVYTFDQDNTDLFEDYFVDALAFKISAYIAMPMTGDPQLSGAMLSSFQQLISQGAAADLNGQHTKAHPSDQIKLRIS